MSNCKDCLDIECTVRNIYNHEKECIMFSPKSPQNLPKDGGSKEERE